MNYDLDRFKSAQESCYAEVLEEIKSGKKRGHWMWFIFPQIAGLGKSDMAAKYAIADMEEAICYLNDELLGGRLIELTNMLAYEIDGKSANEIFGYPDDLKFHSSMTLFHLAGQMVPRHVNETSYVCFQDAISKYFEGKLDLATLRLLKAN